MAEVKLDRLQADLEIVKAALAADFPYDRTHVCNNLLAALGGVLVALLSLEAWAPVVRSLLFAYFAGGAVLYAWQQRRFYGLRRDRPRMWNWNRQELVASAIAMVAILAYVFWVRSLAESRGTWSFAAWRDQMAGPILFFAGVAFFVICGMRAERRSGLGWAVCLSIAGLIIPWCEKAGQVHLSAGLAILAGGTLSAAILLWQMRRWEAEHVAD
jgi:hypothetical protein